MKKLAALSFVPICILGLVGCRKTIRASDVYAFPEPTTQITGSFYSQGIESNFTIGPEGYDPDDLSVMPVIEWFYGLELRECEGPEPVDGNESCSFIVDGQPAFTYDVRGSEAFIIVDDRWYEVENPSNPPIEGNTENEVIEFHGQSFNKSDLTEETLEWLGWYNSLSPEERLAIRSIPADLYTDDGVGTLDPDAEQ